MFKSFRFCTMRHIAATTACLTLAGVAYAGEDGETAKTRSVVVATTSDGAQTRSVEVNIENEDVKVRINGENVPKDRIERHDDRLIIRNEHGAEILTIPTKVVTGDEMQIILRGPGNYEWSVEPHFDAAYAWLADFGAVGEDVDVVGHVSKADTPPVMLGIQMSEPGQALQAHLRLKPGTTTMIAGVHQDLPAHRAGLAEFDVIVAIDGETPADHQRLIEVLRGRQAGDTITLTVIHEGQKKDVEVTLDAYDAGKLSEAEVIGSASPEPAMPELTESPFGTLRGFHFVAPDGMRFTVPRGFRFSRPEQLGQLERRLQLAPDDKQLRQFFSQQLEKDNQVLREKAAEALRRWKPDAAEGQKPREADLQRRLDDLSKRLAELKELLDELKKDHD